MSITVHEIPESRRSAEGQNPSVELQYLIRGTDDDGAAMVALLYASSLVYAGLVRQSRQIEPIGPEQWRGTVQYRRRGGTAPRAQPPWTCSAKHSANVTTQRSTCLRR